MTSACGRLHAHTHAFARPSWLALLTALAALAAAGACSSDPEGGSGSTGGGTSGGGGCSGAFCLEEKPNIGVDPDKLLFSDLGAGTEQKIDISVVNTGGPGRLSISKASFEPASSEFTLVGFEPTVLDPDAHAKWTVVYKPTKTGGKALNLILENNSDDPARRKFPVPILVKAGSGALKVLPDPIAFGAVASLTTAKKTAKVFNEGDKPITIESVALDGSGSPDFNLTKAPKTPFELAPAASFSVDISFTPSKGGNDTTALLIGYPTNQTLHVAVTGAEIGPLISVVPGVLNYGQVADGAKQTRSFKIFSKGKADLHVTKIELDPASTFTSLFISESGPFTLKPEASKIVDVVLTADKPLPKKSAKVAEVVIHSDDPNIKAIKVPVMVEGEPCVAGKSAFSLAATAAKGQVDIILAIDSSGSMKEEKKAVSSNLNAFAKDIIAKNVDHHVVLIGTGMCVPPPLAKAGCKNSSTFRHVQVSVGSNDGLKKIIETYPQWQDFLRAGAQRHFIMVTDDNSKKDANWFSQQIAALTKPGFPDGFTFHSIVGWAPQIVPFIGCIGAAGHGTVYIALTNNTGGELASICATQLGVPPDWSGLFKKIGQNVVSTVKVQCKYELPKEKDGKAVDPSTVTLSYAASDGSESTVQRVDGKGKGPRNTHGWYFDNAQTPKAAILCPASFKELEGKKMAFHFGC